MASGPLRLLVKTRPGGPGREAPFGARPATLRLDPLFASIGRPEGADLGAAAAPVWHLASVDLDDANPWDLCHELMDGGLRFAGGPGAAGRAKVAFAEPDLEQGWLWATDRRQTLGLIGGCERPEPPDDDVYAVGPGDAWFRGDAFSQLEAAREAVGKPAAAARVRIAHLDTGYDPNHSTKPAHLRLDLQRNFADDDRPHDATDRPTAPVNPMHGHGTGTLGLLAGDAVGGKGKPLGGAPQLEVVPIRVANWVVLFRNSAIARAFDYVHGLWDDPGTRVHVVTMSMGGIASAAWADAVNALYDRGVVVVAAAGNCYANLPTRYCVYPARFRRVIAACGAMANGRPYADLPGRKMAGCYGPRRKEATALAAYTPNVPWAKFGCPGLVDLDGGGTSAATPQVAAAAALWIQRHGKACDDYPKPWMRVEAVRKALFDSALEADPTHYGRGILRANDALGVPPASARALKAQEKDSASFALLRVLTGLGIGAAPSDRQRMLELEALQISQRSDEIEGLLGGLDPDDPAALASADARRVLEALGDHASASAALKGEIARWRGGAATPPGGPEPPPKGAPAAPSQAAPSRAADPEIPPPPARHLRVYAFDPLLGTRLETLAINEAAIAVAWEADLRPGPVGEYLEIVDVDPPSGHVYAPVDLNRPEILAQHGLGPTEGNPQFHQQMAYAVIMKTIGHFQRALGRVALWAERRVEAGGRPQARFVRRLRVYPHALREANAYYSPAKSALLFGYFNAPRTDAGDNLPGGTVFTCLSHDIVAHEATHALLDGLHPRFAEQTGIDNLAFHEAFADIVALFQHFTLPEALRHQIAQCRGDLALARLLGGLAAQFGQAIGERGALRSAIARFDEETGAWERLAPSQDDYEATQQPHARGAVLVAAVFDAFLQIYEHRTGDLVRLATGGSGVLPNGHIPHDLVERLAREAAKVASQVLNICIRALDYCPPVDLHFGEYLRALITADFDAVPDDDRSYRVAFVSAFRARGIFPRGVRTLSVDSLLWQAPELPMPSLAEAFQEMTWTWDTRCDRYRAYRDSRRNAGILHGHLLAAFDERHFAVLGLYKTREGTRAKIDGQSGEVSRIEVHSVRPARRVSPDGELRTDVVIEITQRWHPDKLPDAFFRAGSTILCDLESGAIRYVVRKRIGNHRRVGAEQAFRRGVVEGSLGGNYFSREERAAEPFALLHRDA